MNEKTTLGTECTAMYTFIRNVLITEHKTIVINIFPKRETIAFQKTVLPRPDVGLSSLQVLWGQNSCMELTGVTCSDG